MEETHAEENARLLAPYIVRRNELAHEVLSKLLDGQYLHTSDLLAEYQVACMAVEAAGDICRWFDNGSVTVSEFGPDSQGNSGVVWEATDPQ